MTRVGPDGRVRVNCGLQHPISLPVPSGTEVEEGERVTVRVSSREPVRAKLTDEPAPGFQVDRADLTDAVTRADAGLVVAASRHGDPLTVDRLDGTVERIHGDEEGSLTVAFGAPGRGLPAILEDGETDARFDRWLSTVPNQGSETIHTEEAVWATLAPLTLER